MDFKTCVRQQAKMHPAIEPQDMYKLCFQAAFGAEHLIADEQRARAYLQQEFDRTDADANTPLIEWLCEDVARVNLAAYKALGYSIDRLLVFFISSAKSFGGNKDRLEGYLEQTAELASEGIFSFTESEWKDFCKDKPVGPVHHSAHYRDMEYPAYRIIAGKELKELEEFFNEDSL